MSGHLAYVYHAHSPADARHFVRDALVNAPPATVAAAELLTSEIVTNALEHAKAASTVIGLESDDDSIRVEVRDPSPVRPEVVSPNDPDVPGGYGVTIVDVVASSWGVDDHPEGKVVWFVLQMDPKED